MIVYHDHKDGKFPLPADHLTLNSTADVFELTTSLIEAESESPEWGTLRNKVYHVIRESILSGRISPGSVLTLRGVAQSLGTSVMPVREAVMRLVTEGAISLNLNRTFTISRMSPARFIELRDIRVEIEGWAAELAAAHISADEIETVIDLQNRVERASKQNDFKYLTHNRRFHFAIYNATRKPELVSIIESLWLKYGPALNYFSREDKARGRGNDAHRRIIAAIAARDSAKSRRAIADDIIEASEVILPRLTLDYEQSGYEAVR